MLDFPKGSPAEYRLRTTDDGFSKGKSQSDLQLLTQNEVLHLEFPCSVIRNP